jgi:exosome complex RNA-binding protein Rrp42 (RNase PH superfamily)
MKFAQAIGSARIRIGATEVIASVKVFYSLHDPYFFLLCDFLMI